MSTNTQRLSFDVTDEDYRLIDAIVERWIAIRRKHGLVTSKGDARTVRMDLMACHASGNPLKLDQMLTWERDYDVLHDIIGINKHLDRKTGGLRDCFSPRFTDNRRRGVQ